MRLLIDGNILLDVLQQREPHYEDSSKIWKLCETNISEGYVSALTFANLAYVMRKELSPEMIEQVLRYLSLIFSFEDLKSTDLSDAASMQWPDYEDALQSAAAERLGVDYIITRNVKDYTRSKVTALTPSELLARL
jgi:hypothetical protein